MDAEVIVVGAGFAGLNAARRLAQAGREVLVFEARGRVGGRIWSDTLANGVTVERGGEFIFSNYQVVRELVGEFGLELETQGFGYSDREVRKRAEYVPFDAREASAVFERHRRASCADNPHVSLAEVLNTAPLLADQREILRTRLTCTLTADPTTVAAAFTAAIAPGAGFAEAHRVRFGNQQIAEAIASSLGKRVRLRHAVEHVEHDSEGIRVSTFDGRTWESAAVVIALPAPIAARLAVEPSYPSTKAEAYRRLGMGAASKLHIPAAHPLTPRVVQSFDEPVWAWAATDSTDGSSRVVSSLVATPNGQEGLGLSSGAGEWRDRVREFGMPITDVGSPLVTTWNLDPWAQHSYPYRTVGWTKALDGALREPHGRVFFAGDYTADDGDAGTTGTMEGALRTGARAAREVEELLSQAGA